MRTPLNIAAAFWRPWFTDDENKKVQTAQDARGSGVGNLSAEDREQLTAIAQSAAMPEEVSHPTKRKHKAAKPPNKKGGGGEKT